MNRREYSSGLTLIELMVAVSIVAILAGIAYPSYVDHVRTTRRADAQGALMGLAAALERHYTVRNSYKGAAAGGADTGEPGIFPASVPLDGGTPTYLLSIQAATDTAFTIHAAPTGLQAKDRCGTLTLTQALSTDITGQAQGVTKTECWKK